MPTELDFLIGGIARGGTTAFAQALNEHPQVSCFSSETRIVSVLAELGGAGHIPQEALPAVKAYVARTLRTCAFDMVKFNLDRGSPQPPYRLLEADITWVVDEIVGSIADGLHGDKLVSAGSAALAATLRRCSGRPIVGEKTPTNVVALSALGTQPRSKTFCVTREPFAVIRSMRKRVEDPSDIYAAGFPGEIRRQAGLYVQSALSSLRLHEEGAALVRFEDLLARPEQGFREAFRHLEVEDCTQAVQAAAATLNSPGVPEPRADFTAEERAIVAAIAGPVARRLGYEMQPEACNSGLPIGVSAIAGAWDTWLERSAYLCIVREAHHTTADVRFWYSFPGSVADSSDTIRWTASSLSHAHLGEAAAHGGGPGRATIRIDLAADSVEPLFDGRYVHVVQLRCSHAFVPLAHRFRHRLPSLDWRELSSIVEETAVF